MNLIQKQRFDEDETHKFMQHIVSAVDHLHKAGIIHRYTPKIERVLLRELTVRPRPSGGGVWGRDRTRPSGGRGLTVICLAIIVATSNRTNFLLALEVLREILQFGA